MAHTPLETLLIRALQASLRWSYRDTAEHVRCGLPKTHKLSAEYISDVALIRAALAKAA